MGVILDVILLVVFIACIISGACRGAVRTLAGLAGLAAAVFLSPQLGKWLSGVLPAFKGQSQAMREVLCTVLAFVLILVAVGLLCRLLDALCRLPGLHAINRVFGGIFGGVKGVLLVMLVCAVLRLLLPVLAVKYPDKVQLKDFSSSVVLQMPENSSSAASSHSSGTSSPMKSEAEQKVRAFVDKLPADVRNPVYTFYQKVLREGVQTNVK